MDEVERIIAQVLFDNEYDEMPDASVGLSLAKATANRIVRELAEKGYVIQKGLGEE